MSWITLTEADVTQRLTTQEAAKLTDKAGELPPILGNVSNEIRGYCGQHVTLGPVGTIPDELLDMAIIMARFRWLSVLPLAASSSLIELRKDEYDSTLVTMRSVVAKGEFAIVPPDTAAEKQASGAGPSFKARDRQFRRENSDGV